MSSVADRFTVYDEAEVPVMVRQTSAVVPSGIVIVEDSKLTMGARPTNRTNKEMIYMHCSTDQ